MAGIVKQARDLTGKTFGKLIVLRANGIKPKRGILWLCMCECGHTFNVLGSSLRGGQQACRACSRKGINNIGSGVAAFNNIYASYRSGANRRGIAFELSKEEFKGLITQDCFYCGVSPTCVKSGKEIYGEFIYNGIDRVDNSKGYIIDNCVPCCKFCNIAKRDLSQKEFIRKILQTADHIRATGLDKLIEE